MKTTTKKIFDAVNFMREQRDRLSKILSKMTKEEILEYFMTKKMENIVKPSAYQPTVKYMILKTIILALFIFTWQCSVLAQDKTSFDAYKAETEGYFINFMETPLGIIATDNYASNIYLFNNGTYEILFSSPCCGRYMTLSPDKKSIGFKYIQADGKQSPALLNIQTKQITLLHSPVDLCGQVSFSQNGKTSFTIGNELIIKEGNNSKNYSLAQYVNIAPVSPDGNFVIYNDNYDQLFLLNLSNNQGSKLTSGEKGNAYPQWSPDGSKLMYSSISGEIYVYDLQNKTTTFISEGQYPSWTFDSQCIVFTKIETNNLQFTGSDIYKAKYDGSEINNITNSHDDFEIAAVASGNKIIYQSLNKKIVNALLSTINGTFYANLIFKAESPLNISHYGIEKLIKAETRVPGTVPYVNQVYDTPEWHYGYGSCAPTTAIMAIAYYNKIPKWPIVTSNGVGNHISEYGAYVADKYHLNEYYYQDVSSTGGGEDAWGGYGYMWTGSYSPHSRMRQYIANHYLTSVQEDADNYTKALTEINNGYPFPVCNELSAAGHLTLAIGYVNGQHTIIFNDPYGNKNSGSWPNWYGQDSYYDWPGYNNGYQNLNTVYWTVTAEGSEVAYNDTIIDDVFYNQGFYMNNSQNGSVQRYYSDLNAGYNNHYWYTGTESVNSDICFVTWTPNLTAAGNYEIFAYVPGGIGSTAVGAKYRIHHVNGITNVVVDQSQYSAQWVSLGIYSLTAGQINYVYLGDSTGTSSQYIAFDAIKFSNADNVVPTTSISTPNNWKTADFTATFTDADNIGVEKSFYQVLDYDGTYWGANANNGFFADNYDALQPSWTSVTGIWNVVSGELLQTDETQNNTNIYAALSQILSNRYLYHFIAKADGTGTNRRFGFHFFSDNANLTNRGNSYFVWFRIDNQNLQFYKVVNDTFSLVNTVSNVITTPGQYYDYKITYDRISGRIAVWRDNVFLGSWTDPAPYSTGGDYISFRTGNCTMNVNELKVFRSRYPTVTVTLNDNTKDIRYQNPNPTTFGAKIKSIVVDANNNLSAIAYHDLNVDWTPPTDVSVIDGTSNDVDTVYDNTTVSAAWTTSTDPNSGIAEYWYALGSTPGANDIVDWTNNGTNLSVTLTSLNLTLGNMYYFSVKSKNGADLWSNVISSDGFKVLSPEYINIIVTGDIKVYPNPFTESINIVFNNPFSGTVSLTDATGRVILQENVNQAPEHNLKDLSNLEPGIYFIQLKETNGSTHCVSTMRR